MKRIPAPKVKRREPLDGDTKRVIRENLPPHWLLCELLFHIATLCNDVYENVSARMLLDSVLSLRESETNADTFFNETYRMASRKYQVVNYEFLKTIRAPEREAWLSNPESYFEKRDNLIPQYGIFIDVGNFLFLEYRHVPPELRGVIDCAFAGFIFNTLNSPDFASLCKDTALLVPTMTIEQRLDVALDHEALYNRLLVQLGQNPEV